MLRYLVIQERTNLDGTKSVITDKFKTIGEAREFAASRNRQCDGRNSTFK